MSNKIDVLVEECDRIVDTLYQISTENMWEIKAIQLQIKKVRALLLENQKSLWIRTKDGRAMMDEIEKSLSKLTETINVLVEMKPKESLPILHDVVNELVTHVNKIKTEIRKRGLSIT
jgi:CHASE3 domain sensor protein